jgi:hypothetical protein
MSKVPKGTCPIWFNNSLKAMLEVIKSNQRKLSMTLKRVSYKKLKKIVTAVKLIRPRLKDNIVMFLPQINKTGKNLPKSYHRTPSI